MYAYPRLDFNGLTQNEIINLLKSQQLALNPEEALLIQNSILKREPTLAECHLWSIQGSEHCSYKSSRRYLQNLESNAPNVILGPKEDAGIVSVATDNSGKRYGIVMSHESHNHPSQIVPYEGAATGVGGNMRDVCCMGAEVIALADGLRFGDLKDSKTHWIAEGVIEGIGNYGNAAGIPNIAGDTYFNVEYNENCLVTVVTLGVIAEDEIIHSFAPKNAENYVYILVGKATDNSGFGGASFASANLLETEQAQNKGAVQEPDAFLKRHLLKANYALFEKLKSQNLLDVVGFKDLGAGGVACATVEMAEAAGYGAIIQADKIPTCMPNLPPHVLLCSETQERFMWVVPPDKVDLILAHYNHEFDLPMISKGACAAVIGHITLDKNYRVNYQEQVIIEAKASDITHGIVFDRLVANPNHHSEEPPFKEINANEILLQLLAHENIASKACILETYDKQVQGRMVLEAGEADAGVLTPFNEEKYPEEIRKIGVALAVDQNPRFNRIDPYWGAVNAVVEAVRNVVSVGASPQAITDCLCFGNPEIPEHMWEFSESILGIRDACKAIGLKNHPGFSLPVIAGNVSFYNETENKAIPPSPMISCLGVIPDASYAISGNFQQADSVIVLIGERKNELGGSVFYQLHNVLGANVPKPDLNQLALQFHAVIDAIQQNLILSAHDISEGGVAVALSEMCFKNNLGVEAKIEGDLPSIAQLFSETGGFILEIAQEKMASFKAFCKHRSIPFEAIGKTLIEPVLRLQNEISLPLKEAKKCWENGLREKLL